MQDGLQAMVARIDERTEHIQEDVKDLKVGLAKVVDTVNGHSTQLAAIDEKVKSSNNGLSKRQTVGIGGAAGLIASVIVALIELLRH
jgi:pantothenate kinase